MRCSLTAKDPSPGSGAKRSILERECLRPNLLWAKGGTPLAFDSNCCTLIVTH